MAESLMWVSNRCCTVAGNTQTTKLNIPTSQTGIFRCVYFMKYLMCDTTLQEYDK
jgi:hypothetical protein